MSPQEKFGQLVWYCLTTSDTDKACRFYRELFSWQEEVRNLPDVGEMHTMRAAGNEFASVKQLHESEGNTSRWIPFFSVENIGQYCERAEKLGGKVRYPPYTVPNLGTLALVSDPGGGLIHAFERHGDMMSEPILQDKPGHICWSELLSPNVQETSRFYGELNNWSVRHADGSLNGNYFLFTSGEDMLGGLMQIDPQWGMREGTWLPYFDVENVDAVVSRIALSGGQVLFGPADFPGVGRIATAADPMGALFALRGGE